MNPTSAASTLINFNKNIMRVVKEGCELFINPHTEADVLKWEQDVKNVFGDGAQSVGDESCTQAQDGATNHLMGRGMSKADAEAWANHTWEKVLDISEKVRPTVPKVKDVGKFFWAKLLAAVVVGGYVLTAITGVHKPESESEKMYRSIQYEAMKAEQMQNFLVSEEQFNEMIGGLRVAQSAPEPTRDAPAPVAAEAMPIPIAVAAEAAEPVEVEVVTPSGTQNFTSTLGRVYQNVPPPARREIERTVTVPPIAHNYTSITDDPNSCFVRHCMSGGGFHKEFAVGGTPFGTARFKY